jgi:hypothetical protein
MTRFRSQGHSSLPRFDFVVHDAIGRLTALVDARRLFGTDSRWAAEFRQNVLSHGLPLGAGLFVLILPDRLYIWDVDAPADAGPTHEVDAHPLFAPYFHQMGIRPEEIQPMAFELLVAVWLEALTFEQRGPVAPGLTETGLIEAFEGANISRQEPV